MHATAITVVMMLTTLVCLAPTSSSAVTRMMRPMATRSMGRGSPLAPVTTMMAASVGWLIRRQK